jgi:ferredoxin--NADP+ reductase
MARRLVYNATIVERADLTDALAIFRITPDAPPDHRPWFTAGQYCVLGLNNDEMPALGSIQRPMSIASAPEADGPIEFYIRRIAKPQSQNPFTHLLWRLEAGARIHLRTVAAGVFTIEDTIGAADERLRVMVAAGTGIAPYMSMLRSQVSRNPGVDLAKWVLLHGVSYPADLGYREELVNLCSANRLKYLPTVSRARAPEWSGDSGRVESYFESDRLSDLEARFGLLPHGFIPENAVVFVCGLTGTIRGTVVRLIDRAFVPNGEKLRRALGVPTALQASVYFEDYDPDELLIDVNNAEVMEPLRARMHTALAAAQQKRLSTTRLLVPDSTSAR